MHLFVLSPPYSGSTVLAQLLATSPQVASLPDEGQFVDGVAEHLRVAPWDARRPRPWDDIRATWDRIWGDERPIRLEKSPPNLARAAELEARFEDAAFVCLVRDPYATAEGLARRRGVPPMEVVTERWSRVDALRHAALLWVRLARLQEQNLATLRRATPVTYEQLTDDPAGTAAALQRWLPELGTLDHAATFEAHSVHGRGDRPLTNLNADKLARLTDEEVDAVRQVLAAATPLPFGYATTPSAR